MQLVYLRFQEGETKNLQDLKISAKPVDSPCTQNPLNWRRVVFLTYLKKNLNNGLTMDKDHNGS